MTTLKIKSSGLTPIQDIIKWCFLYNLLFATFITQCHTLTKIQILHILGSFGSTKLLIVKTKVFAVFAGLVGGVGAISGIGFLKSASWR